MMTALTKQKIGWLLLAILAAGSLANAQEKSQPVARVGLSGHFEPDWGLVVQRVEPGSAAEQIGMQKGDVILELNGANLRSLGHYYRLLGTSPGRIQFTVEEVRSRKIVHRSLFLRQHGGTVEVFAKEPGEPAIAISEQR